MLRKVRNHQSIVGRIPARMSNLVKDNDYDPSFDVGVAVKEELPEAALKPKKKWKKLGRSSNGMQHMRLESAASTDAEEGKSPNGCLFHKAALTYDYTSAAAIGSTARSETKSKKKRKREKSTDSEADDGISDERSSKSPIHSELTSELDRKQKKLVLTPLPLKGMFVNERKNLPVYQHSAEIVDLISNNDVVLVVAETVSET